MSNSEKFCDRLKSVRVHNGMSVDSLAETLGVSRQAVYGWEQGYRQPNMDILVKLSSLLHVSVDYLLNISDCMSVAKPSGTALVDSDPIRYRLLMMYQNFPNLFKAITEVDARKWGEFEEMVVPICKHFWNKGDTTK